MWEVPGQNTYLTSIHALILSHLLGTSGTLPELAQPSELLYLGIAQVDPSQDLES